MQHSGHTLTICWHIWQEENWQSGKQSIYLVSASQERVSAREFVVLEFTN